MLVPSRRPLGLVSRRGALVMLPLLIAVTMISCSPANDAPIKRTPRVPPAPTTEWLSWGPEPFERAKSEGRIVLVDAGIEGCTACRRMHEQTYAHPGVRRQIAKHFVPVAVDADQQPDLGSLYEPWGWPATIFLSADGKPLRAVRGRVDPDDLLKIMAEVVHNPTPQKGGAGGPGLEDLDLSARCTRMVERLDEVGDEHGWGGRTRTIGSAPVLYSFHRVGLHGEKVRAKRALAATEGFRQLIDPVWGGVFVGARNPDWTGIIPEKRLVHQAQALEAFTAAYRHTNDKAWLEAAAAVLRYLHAWLRDDDGAYYATQDDEPRSPGLPLGMSIREYYDMSDEGRRVYGVPPVDKGIYTDQNARLVRALVLLFGATRNDKVLKRALRTMAVLEKRVTPEGWAVQVSPDAALSSDERLRPAPIDGRLYLAPQVHLGVAALGLHQVTKEDKWLELANTIGKATVVLQDEDGGFFAGASRDTDGLVPRSKPYLETLYAARFYTWLGTVTSNEAFIERAERALRYAGQSGVLYMRGPANIATYAHALDEFLNRKGGDPLCGR
jgi:uncharacterized protein YyaL (SSP411 family)